jgi:hypothetical protein
LKLVSTPLRRQAEEGSTDLLALAKNGLERCGSAVPLHDLGNHLLNARELVLLLSLLLGPVRGCAARIAVGTSETVATAVAIRLSKRWRAEVVVVFIVVFIIFDELILFSHPQLLLSLTQKRFLLNERTGALVC